MICDGCDREVSSRFLKGSIRSGKWLCKNCLMFEGDV